VNRATGTSGARVDALVEGICARDRAAIGRAITLVESTLEADREDARALLHRCLPLAGVSHRVGITGVPGAGKSTFIERLGMQLVETGRRVAVLTIDPSSARGGGSILGDKTRMTELARQDAAFVRPSPSGGSQGGVGRATREGMVLLEAAGFDVVLVETVGVGQSEVVVADMVDTFVLLTLAGAGDDLQGIKRGVLELADVIAVNKADGENLPNARLARAETASALKLMTPRHDAWRPRVLTCSAATGDGVPEVWATVVEHREALQEAELWHPQRARQRTRWMQRTFERALIERASQLPAVRSLLNELGDAVAAGRVFPDAAAEALLSAVVRDDD
jgi:LAO/AO transport system kinase